MNVLFLQIYNSQSITVIFINLCKSIAAVISTNVHKKMPVEEEITKTKNNHEICRFRRIIQHLGVTPEKEKG